jgi:hypothetical protein
MRQANAVAAIVLGAAGWVGAPLWAAEDQPDAVLAAAAAKPAVYSSKVEDDWKAFLAQQGYGDGWQSGGVLYIEDRDLVFASASEFTRVGVGQPGWVESRIAAFEQAELSAKAKIIRFIANTATAERSTSLLEKSAWSDGSAAEAQELSKAAKMLSSIGQKSLQLTEASLDNALKAIDPDYRSDKQLDVAAKKTVLEERFSRKLENLAMRTSVGIVPVHSGEGPVGAQYQVLVGMAWSPKLNRVAMSLFNKEYNIPPTGSGKRAEDYIPTDRDGLVAMLGARVVKDEKGDFMVMAYGQAQPRPAPAERAQSAAQLAKEIAAERARGQLVNFVREGIAMSSDERSTELSREFSDMTVGTETMREVRRRIDAKGEKLELKGLRVATEWVADHPASGQPVAGAVVVWSPTGAKTAAKMTEAMDAAQRESTAPPAREAASTTTPKPEERALKAPAVDTGAY